MNEVSSFTPPEVTDGDIRRASDLLNLKADAFFGSDGRDPRQNVLKFMESLDVAACPGSGKTTLLVAKLAILAEKWTHLTRGICVLSHTNAARTEIETKLGNTTAGRRLLSYPHFIGTIHGFVNEFLSLPILRSQGHVPIRFNSEISAAKIWKLSGFGRSIPAYLRTTIRDDEQRKSAMCNAQFTGENLDIRLVASNVDLVLRRKNSTPAFQALDKWKKLVLKEGFANYEDTFAFGHRALKNYAFLTSGIRDRFPLLFIDEAQDNSKAQSAILHQIFMAGKHAVIRQRFGDSNQAIYNFAGDTGADDFPDEKITVLPNSHRFGQTICNLADPLGVEPCGLKGHGPKDALASGAREGRHTVFLFRPQDMGKVLEAYGAMLLETFSDRELREGSFWAVGMVHQPPDKEGAHKFPHHIRHYWPDYDPDVTRADPQPETFVQYVLAGMAKAETTGEAFHAIEKMAEGILRLAGMAEGGVRMQQRKHQHRYVLQLLEGDTEGRARYETTIERLVLKRASLAEQTWNADWHSAVTDVATRIMKRTVAGAEVEDFLRWPYKTNATASPPTNKSRGNLFRYAQNGREVTIQVGSVHSVKGKTTTAILVLETFWHAHNLEKLKAWLSDVNVKKGWRESDGVQQKTRLKIHYVAMTRGTHLLCLAMKRADNCNLDPKAVQQLEQRGWQIKCL